LSLLFIAFIFTYPPSCNYCMILEINMAHHYKFMCPLYSYVESFHVIIMNEHHIHNLPTLTILIPPHSPCTPFADCAHLFAYCFNTSADYENTSANCTNFSTNYANKFDECANTIDD
jgi:hypothetical protein